MTRKRRETAIAHDDKNTGNEPRPKKKKKVRHHQNETRMRSEVSEPKWESPKELKRESQSLPNSNLQLDRGRCPGPPAATRPLSAGLQHGMNTPVTWSVKRASRSGQNKESIQQRALHITSLRKLIAEALAKADRNIVEVPAAAIVPATTGFGRTLQPHRLHQIANEIFLTSKVYKKWSKGFYICKHPDCGGYIAIGGNHRAYVSKKVGGFVSAAKIADEDLREAILKMKESEKTTSNSEWDDTILRHICTEIDNQDASDDCRTLGDEVRRFKLDALDAFPIDSQRLRFDPILGIKIIAKTVVEFFAAVWNRPVAVGGNRLSKCVPENETYQPINLPVALAKAYDRMASRDRLNRIFTGLNRLSSWPGLVEILDEFPEDTNRNRNNESRLYIIGTMRQEDFKELARYVLKLSPKQRGEFDVWNISSRARRSKLSLKPPTAKGKRKPRRANKPNSKSKQKPNDSPRTKKLELNIEKAMPWHTKQTDDDVDPEEVILTKPTDPSTEDNCEPKLTSEPILRKSTEAATTALNENENLRNATSGGGNLNLNLNNGEFDSIPRLRQLAQKQPRFGDRKQTASATQKLLADDDDSPSCNNNVQSAVNFKKSSDGSSMPAMPSAIHPKASAEDFRELDIVTNDKMEIPNADCRPEYASENLYTTRIEKIPEMREIQTLLNFIPPSIRSEAVQVSLGIVERTARLVAKKEIAKSNRLQDLCAQKDERIEELAKYNDVQADIIQSLKDDLQKARNELFESIDARREYHRSDTNAVESDQIYHLTTPPPTPSPERTPDGKPCGEDNVASTK